MLERNNVGRRGVKEKKEREGVITIANYIKMERGSSNRQVCMFSGMFYLHIL